ncbi:MAG: ECF-type sigma factor [Phycisphaerales bacterium]|nr:ECF-type sigma factor [Phycisphaerales bacterium]
MATNAGEVTKLLDEAADGNSIAAESLWQIAQQEIRGQAEMLVAREKQGAELQPTMLINEAWLKIHGGTDGPPRFNSSREFYGAIWRVMRQILVDYARARQSLKRGGDRKRVDLDLAVDGLRSLDNLGDETSALLPALDRLRELDPMGFEVFWGRFALGLNREQVAEMLDMEINDVDMHWRHARAWLKARITEDNDNS